MGFMDVVRKVKSSLENVAIASKSYPKEPVPHFRQQYTRDVGKKSDWKESIASRIAKSGWRPGGYTRDVGKIKKYYKSIGTPEEKFSQPNVTIIPTKSKMTVGGLLEKARIYDTTRAGYEKEQRAEKWSKRMARLEKFGRGMTQAIETGSPRYLARPLTSGEYRKLKPKGVIARKTIKGMGTRYLIGGGAISYRPTKKGGISGRYVGRPRKSFKPRVDPMTGRIIRVPANLYYKIKRRAKKVMSQQAQAVRQQRIQQYVRRGISPDRAAQMELQRQMYMQRQAQLQSQMLQSQMPPTSPQMPVTRRFQMRRPIPYPQPNIQPNFFTGGTQIRQKEAWLN